MCKAYDSLYLYLELILDTTDTAHCLLSNALDLDTNINVVSTDRIFQFNHLVHDSHQLGVDICHLSRWHQPFFMTMIAHEESFQRCGAERCLWDGPVGLSGSTFFSWTRVEWSNASVLMRDKFMSSIGLFATSPTNKIEHLKHI